LPKTQSQSSTRFDFCFAAGILEKALWQNYVMQQTQTVILK